MTEEERQASHLLVYQCLPSRYGFDPAHLRRADAIEIVIGQGAKPGGGGMLLGQKVSDAGGRDAHPARGHRPALGLPAPGLGRARTTCASRSRSCARPRTGRSRSTSSSAPPGSSTTSSWRSPRAPTWSCVDGMQGGTGATQDVFIEHAGIPTLAAVRQAVRGVARARVWRTRCSSSSPAASAPAPTSPRRSRSARPPSRSGVAPLIALGCNAPHLPSADGVEHDATADYRALGHRARAPATTAHRPLPGRDRHPGPRAGGAARPRAGCAAGGQLPASR